MKTLRILALTSLVAGFGLMTSCDSTSSTAGPAIKDFQIANTDGTGFNEATDSLAAGSSVAVYGEVTSDAGLGNVTVVVKDASGATKLSLPNTTSATDYVFGPGKSVTITIATTSSWASGRYSVQLTATDKNGNTASSSSLPLLVKGGTTTPGGTATTEHTGIVYDVNGPASATGAYDLVGDAKISKSTSESVKDLKDITAVGEAFDGALSSGNGATFVKASSSFAYATATVESITAAFNAGSSLTSIPVPSVGDVYLVKTSRSGAVTYIALKFTAVKPELTSANDGSVSFTYRK